MLFALVSSLFFNGVMNHQSISFCRQQTSLILRSFCLQVLEMLRRRGGCSEDSFDAMGLLQTLCLVKLDSVDGNKGKTDVGKLEEVKTSAAGGAAANDGVGSTKSAAGNDTKTETEMKGESFITLFNAV